MTLASGKRLSGCLALAAALLLAAVAAPAEERTAVVKVPRANIRSGPGTIYPAVTTVEQGARLKVLEQSGDWYRVPLPREGHGWIFKEVISLEEEDQPKPSSGGLLDSLKRGFQSSRQSEMTAAAGSRGLGEEEGKTSMAVDYDAVGRMEKYSVTSEEVRAFVREGGLKPERTP